MTVENPRNRPLVVFLVDEDPAVGTTLTETLRSSGCEVRTFQSGRELVAHRPETPPDVVITEYMVGPIDGLKVAAWTHHAYPEARVIMITGSARVVEHFAGNHLPFPVMEKPLSSAALIAAVHGFDLDEPMQGTWIA